jgi:hypothetical protein
MMVVLQIGTVDKLLLDKALALIENMARFV